MYSAIVMQFRSLSIVPQAVLVGILLGIGFVIPSLSILGLLGVMLFIFCINNHESLSKAVFFGQMCWAIKMLFVLSWGFSIYPIEWIATDSFLIQWFFILFYLAVSVLVIGLGGALCAFVLFKTKKYLVENVLISAILIPGIWIFSEVIGSLLFSIFYLGPGISPNINFSFGYIGYLAAQFPLLLLLSKWGGVYTLTAVFVFLSVLGYYCFEFKKHTTKIITSGSMLVALAIWANVPTKTLYPADPTVNIAVVSTSFGSTFSQDRYISLEEAVSAASELSVDYIILPEDSRFLQSKFGSNISSIGLLNAYQFTGGDSQKMLIDSGRVDIKPGAVALRAYLIDGKNEAIFEYDKQYLVPQGEFMPYSMSTLFSLAGFSDAVASQAIDSAYQPGPKLQVGYIPANIPGILFCSEAVDPWGVAKITRNRTVPFVASPVSHAWFHNSKILSAQVDTMLQIQAVMNGISIVSAGNMEESKVYKPTGEITFGTKQSAGQNWNVRFVSLP